MAPVETKKFLAFKAIGLELFNEVVISDAVQRGGVSSRMWMSCVLVKDHRWVSQQGVARFPKVQ